MISQVQIEWVHSWTHRQNCEPWDACPIHFHQIGFVGKILTGNHGDLTIKYGRFRLKFVPNKTNPMNIANICQYISILHPMAKKYFFWSKWRVQTSPCLCLKLAKETRTKAARHKQHLLNKLWGRSVGMIKKTQTWGVPWFIAVSKNLRKWNLQCAKWPT